MQLSDDEIKHAVRIALAEDIGPGDVTTDALVPPGATLRAVMTAREPMVVAGLALAEAAFLTLWPTLSIHRTTQDGAALRVGEALLEVRGLAGPILSGERVALNFVQRLSGIATLTAQFVQTIAGTQAKILDTRKTTPGLRRLEKYGVVCGGGTNHRFGLFDMVLIKDNHLTALRDEMPNAITVAIARARRRHPNLKVEVEADTLEQVRQAADAGADIIMLDNMPVDCLRAAVEIVQHRALTEASGGVRLDTVRAIAETGVDYISVGALTHSARAVDIGLDSSQG